VPKERRADYAFRDAISSGKYDVAKNLVLNGLDPNQYANAFYYIFSNENLEFQQQIDIIKDISCDRLNTPLLLAYANDEQNNYQKIVDAFNINLYDTVIQEDYYRDEYSNLGKTILHIAAGNLNNDLVEYLIGEMDINVLDNNKHTALFYAITAYGPRIDWKEPIIEDDNNAKIKFIGDMPFYRNPQQVQEKQFNTVMMFLNNKIDINLQNYAGWTVLHYASASYPKGLQELLIEYGADENVKTNFGRTARNIIEAKTNSNK
jgi:ankyrin repeat protein